MTTPLHAASGSTAEDLFIELFSDTFGAEKAGYLYSSITSMIFTTTTVLPIL